MNIAVAATPSVAIPALNALLESEHHLDFVITQPDRPSGRGRGLAESDVSLWCSDKKIVCHKPQSISETMELLQSVDLLITIGYGVILPESAISIPKKGCLNLHFSLLPRWRGAAPVQRAIEAGDLISGVTVFKLDSGMDTGPIYVQKRFALDSDISSDALLQELAELGPEAILESMRAIEDGLSPAPQDNSLATRALKLSREEAEVNWNSSAEEIDRKIRAFTSSPGAWTTFRGNLIKVDSPEVSVTSLQPGAIKVIDKKFLVGTSTRAIALGFVTAAGKQRMDAISWSHGARCTDEDRFG